MIKSAVLALVTTAAVFAASSAHAGVHWSVGVNLPVPVVGAVVSSGPVYGASYYAPAPVYAAPAPVYLAPPVVYAPRYYYPRSVYYRPAPVIYGYGYGYGYGYRGWHAGWR